ncbi:MAG: 50S ribosomal protein L16 [Candidatus Gygaella obscura]|nr:50S ribosomal protein L16 [Candidatus Gygaella obscura]
MAFIPKRVKFRKFQRGKRRGLATKGNTLVFGEFGLKALNNGFVTNSQLESCRVVLVRQLRQGGKLWIRVYPNKSITKKPLETRMGKGKGDISQWICNVRRGKVLFEIGGIPESYARGVFRLAAYKLSLKTKFVTREHVI